MKKITLITALLSITLQSAFANDAPSMRGEYSTLSLPIAADISRTPVAGLPTPSVSISNINTIATTLIPQTTDSTTRYIDATLIDDFINDISPNARHYPPNFPNRTIQYSALENIKHLSAWIEPYANASNASFEVLLRAAKINAMGRNMDLGSEYGVRASTQIAKALKLQPNHAEANFLYGMMLAEGGGFKEGEKYLQKAASLGYVEAEQSLAQSDLLNDNRQAALTRLQRLQGAHPNHPQLATQIDIINNGGFYIWDIKDSNINIKPNQ